MSGITTVDPILVLILRFVAEYGPALSQVCRRWRRLLLGSRRAPKQPVALAPSLLAARGHLDLLVGARRQIDSLRTAKRWARRILPINIEKCMHAAAAGGHMAVVQQCQTWGVSQLACDIAMMHAAEAGHMAIVLACRAWGSTGYDGALTSAAAGGHLAIMRQAKAWGATDFSMAMANAACGGHLVAVAQCKTWGATYYAGAAYAAAGQGHLEIVQACKHWGVSPSWTSTRPWAQPRGMGTSKLCGSARSGAPGITPWPWARPHTAATRRSLRCVGRG